MMYNLNRWPCECRAIPFEWMNKQTELIVKKGDAINKEVRGYVLTSPPPRTPGTLKALLRFLKILNMSKRFPRNLNTLNEYTLPT